MQHMGPKFRAPSKDDVSEWTLAGGKNLGIKHGQHIDYNRPHLKEDYTLNYDEWKALCGKPKDEKARLSNVMITMLQKMEVNDEKFVDSLGPVSELI